ncbi:hypothetical protein [Brevundimonas sp.]|uniref:hypothetical protein n=1 Tax=Brevundimonas sp. TaxID=1871086 RepID=UPI0025BD3137|nr:hypothetical protein [Brevundimonas sp.]
MIALMLAGLLAAASPSSASAQEPTATATRGAPGICIRWARNRSARVAEARVVRSSGNVALDRRLAEAVPQMDWPVGVDDYRGQWVGIWMAVGGASTPEGPLPDCSSLPDRSWTPAPTPAPAG